MKKVHWVTRKGNRWVRRTRWQLEAEDKLVLVVFVIILGIVVFRGVFG